MKRMIFFMSVLLSFSYAGAQRLATFDDLPLDPETFYNGSDGAGGFCSGSFWFPNEYNSDWNYWSGFSVSNTTDTVSGTLSNQYSAITGKGADGSSNYAVAYIPGELTLELNSESIMSGFNITNSTYVYYTLLDGDAFGFSKKFGGIDGSDPDYLELLIWGSDTDGNPTDTLHFPLADYRHDDPAEKYILNSWEWIELSDLGLITKLHFAMEGSDKGDFGLNSPTYFCMDNLTEGNTLISESISKRELTANIYPNPFNDRLFVDLVDGSGVATLYNIYGAVVSEVNFYSQSRLVITTPDQLPAGLYLLNILTDEGEISQKVIKR